MDDSCVVARRLRLLNFLINQFPLYIHSNIIQNVQLRSDFDFVLDFMKFDQQLFINDSV